MNKKFTDLPIATSLNGAEITAIVKDDTGTLTSQQATLELIKNYVLTGNAATATRLATPRTINSVAFDGTQNINITATLGTGALTTGLVKSTTGSGAISIAVAGTDYQSPIGTISGIVKGNGANAVTAAVAGIDYQSAQSVNGIVKSSGTTRSAAVAGSDYIAPYTSQAANTFLAAPSGSTGTPTFRLLTSADIPSTLGATAHTGSVTLNASANLIFTGSSSGTVTFSAGATPAAQTYTLPTAYPTVNGYVLSSTTLGVMTWTTAGSSTSNLDSLTDVIITTPTTGQVLKYNGSNWINDADAVSGGGGVGTVTTVSVVGANGFAGTVATATSTPAITITTSITGVLKGNGTAISAATLGTDYAPGTSTLATGIVKSTTTTGALSIAVAGTDYQSPIGTISGIVKGNGANALVAAVAGTDYQAPVSAVGLLKSSGASGNVSAAVAGTDYQSAQSVTGIVKSSGTTRTAAVAGIDYQAPITLTTTGSSGAATFNGTTLNIPQYSGGASSFSSLSDVGSAGLTVDEIYLPAITMLVVTTPVFNYNIDQYLGDNPAIYVISGTTIAFNLQVGSIHPFLLQNNNGSWVTMATANLIHVSTSGVVTTGSSAQGKTSGTLYWKIPASVSGTFRYICQNHSTMVGTITVKDIATI